VVLLPDERCAGVRMFRRKIFEMIGNMWDRRALPPSMNAPTNRPDPHRPGVSREVHRP
jgi:hypothetical protein